MSAGGFMATQSALEKYLFLWLEDFAKAYDSFPRGKGPKFYWDDQLALRRLHREHFPNIRVDSLSKIFTRRDDKINQL